MANLTQRIDRLERVTGGGLLYVIISTVNSDHCIILGRGDCTLEEVERAVGQVRATGRPVTILETGIDLWNDI